MIVNVHLVVGSEEVAGQQRRPVGEHSQREFVSVRSAQVIMELTALSDVGTRFLTVQEFIVLLSFIILRLW